MIKLGLLVLTLFWFWRSVGLLIIAESWFYFGVFWRFDARDVKAIWAWLVPRLFDFFSNKKVFLLFLLLFFNLPSFYLNFHLLLHSLELFRVFFLSLDLFFNDKIVFCYNSDLVFDKQSTYRTNNPAEHQKVDKPYDQGLVLILDTLLIIECLVICKPVKALTFLQLFEVSQVFANLLRAPDKCLHKYSKTHRKHLQKQD